MAADLFGDEPEPPAGRSPSPPIEAASDPRPLADRLRPTRLEDVAGQAHLLGPEGPIGRMVAQRRLSSLILWGPPGVGKTTIARLLADATDLHFEQISAIFSGVADLKKVFAAAETRRRLGRGTLLFVDEIHRFNKAQQDGFLPHLESGLITLVGATTENPSFELNAALLSRAQVLTLTRLDDLALEELLTRAEALEGAPLALTQDARSRVVAMADGDGRALLNLVEQVYAIASDAPLEPADLSERLMRRAAVYDKSGDGHYNLISALHKSVRASDPDAALYWLCRMLEAGEAPLYLARRLVRMAVEDIGLADPQSLTITLAARDAYEFLGSPEGELALAQATLHLALAPKSNAAYVAYKAARRDAVDTGSLPPKAMSVNAATSLMRDQGYGAGYAYDHDAPDGFSGSDHFPDGVDRRRYYEPVERGFERELSKRRAWFDRRRAAARGDDGAPPDE